jgi:hypothetical protein
VQEESPVDLLEFFILTPLPGSADHQQLYKDRAHRNDLPPRQGLRHQAGALLNHILQFPFTFLQENVHPLQGGYIRRKLRRQRRAGLPRESPLVFYTRRVGEILETHFKLAAFYLYLHRIRRRVERDSRPYTDEALTLIEPQALSAPHREKTVIAGAAV